MMITLLDLGAWVFGVLAMSTLKALVLVLPCADYTQLDLQGGLALGIVATDVSNVRVIPAAVLTINWARGELEDVSGATQSDTETFGTVDLAVGFVISEVWSIRPGVSIPFAIDGGDVTFGIVAGFSFGSRS